MIGSNGDIESGCVGPCTGIIGWIGWIGVGGVGAGGVGDGAIGWIGVGGVGTGDIGWIGCTGAGAGEVTAAVSTIGVGETGDGDVDDGEIGWIGCTGVGDVGELGWVGCVGDVETAIVDVGPAGNIWLCTTKLPLNEAGTVQCADRVTDWPGSRVRLTMYCGSTPSFDRQMTLLFCVIKNPSTLGPSMSVTL